MASRREGIPSSLYALQSFTLLLPVTQTRRCPTLRGDIRLSPSTTLGFKSWRIRMGAHAQLRVVWYRGRPRRASCTSPHCREFHRTIPGGRFRSLPKRARCGGTIAWKNQSTARKRCGSSPGYRTSYYARRMVPRQ